MSEDMEETLLSLRCQAFVFTGNTANVAVVLMMVHGLVEIWTQTFVFHNRQEFWLPSVFTVLCVSLIQLFTDYGPSTFSNHLLSEMIKLQSDRYQKQLPAGIAFLFYPLVIGKSSFSDPLVSSTIVDQSNDHGPTSYPHVWLSQFGQHRENVGLGVNASRANFWRRNMYKQQRIILRKSEFPCGNTT